MLLGVWQHVAFTFDGTDALGMNIYYNGVQKIRITSSNTLSTSIINSVNVQIGGVSSIGLYNNVIVTLPRLWTVEKTPAEITAEYNALLAPPPSGNIIMDIDIDNSTYNGSEWDVVDKTGITCRIHFYKYGSSR